MGETTVNKLPYPEDENAPDGPTQIKALADLLDTLKWGSRNLKPTLVTDVGTEKQNLESASYIDVKGIEIEITPAVASIAVIHGHFFLYAGALAARPAGSVKIDAAAELTPAAELYVPNLEAHAGATVSMTWLAELTAAKHTIKGRATAGAVVGGTYIEGTKSRITVELYAA